MLTDTLHDAFVQMQCRGWPPKIRPSRTGVTIPTLEFLRQRVWGTKKFGCAGVPPLGTRACLTLQTGPSSYGMGYHDEFDRS